MQRKQIMGLLVSTAAAVALFAAACSSPAAPAPTQAPAAPKAAEPTKAAAAPAATTAPAAPAASKTAFPEKGKSIMMTVPFAAGGSTDIGARLLATGMEKALGTSVQVQNRAGAGSQSGLTDIVKSKPDGYNIGFANLPTANLIYSDPDRKAVFSGKDFIPVGVQVVDPSAIAVKADSPYKSVKDLVEAAKKAPETIKFGSDGPMTDDHLGIFQLEQASGAKFAMVGFDGSAPNMSALLGGHIDATFGHVGDFLSPAKAGQVRVIGIADKEKSKFFPEAQTLQEQGYNITNSSSRTLVVPAGTPQDVVDVLSAAMKKAMDEPEHIQKMQDAGLTLRYMNSKDARAYWDSMDAPAKALVDQVRAAGKK
ncbi:MAG TPA: tripartite tricarboxylate transporter substrate binding protein [Chloroflexota bacterium]|nr:tripartite tricarboxylate transporter substrate binding protein [Chloroflexota bacterium]